MNIYKLIDVNRDEKRYFSNEKSMLSYLTKHIEYDTSYRSNRYKNGKLVAISGKLEFITKVGRKNGAVANSVEDLMVTTY